MKTSALIVTLFGAVALVAGCGGPSVVSPPTAGSTAATASRPETLDLTGRDPCALLSTTDQAALEIQSPGDEDTNSTFGNGRECSYHTLDAELRVILVTNEGISAWNSGQHDAVVKPTDTVLGFPAVARTLPDDIDSGRCDVLVDTASGQYLAASVQTVGQAANLPPACTYAHQLAEAAMRTLVSGS